MSKYTDEELRAMAIAALRYRDEGFVEWKMMISVLWRVTGLHPQQIIAQIEQYANMEI